MKLKDNLRFLRRKEGLTQEELAKKMHLRQYNISDYEIGRIEPSIATLNRFADLFHVSIDFLVGRKAKEADTEPVEASVKGYIDEMQIDKYLIRIYDDIKGLDQDKKQMVADSVDFLCANVIDKK
jgi:transcriptional regulator with XRE-family HTH domain